MALNEARLKSRARESGREMSDRTLLERIRDGDMGALGVLFDRYEKDVRRVLSRLCVAPEDVDDLVQSTFLDAMRSAGHYDGRESAKPWLCGIAVVMVRRHRRSVGRMLRNLAAWARQAPEEQSAETPESEMDRHQTAFRAKQALKILPEKKREVFVLVTMEGLSGEEAAKALGIPVATVWTRLHHARLELRKALAEEGR